MTLWRSYDENRCVHVLYAMPETIERHALFLHVEKDARVLECNTRWYPGGER